MGIEPGELAWIRENGLNPEDEIRKSMCKNTGRVWNGIYMDITIACIDNTNKPYIMWWYRGSKCSPNINSHRFPKKKKDENSTNNSPR